MERRGASRILANLTSGHSGHAASSPCIASALLLTPIIMQPALCSNGDQVGVNDDNDGDG